MLPIHYLIDTKDYSLYTILGKTNIDVNNDFAKFYANIYIVFRHAYTKEKFKITPISHYEVVNKMKTAVDWFYDKKMNDLFVVDERNVLVFNNDYNKLCVLIHSDDNQHIEIRPVVNNTKSERGKEGVIIRINRMDSSIVLDREEFERIYFYLANFSYQTEMQLLLNVKTMASSHQDKQYTPNQYNPKPNVFGLY